MKPNDTSVLVAFGSSSTGRVFPARRRRRTAPRPARLSRSTPIWPSAALLRPSSRPKMATGPALELALIKYGFCRHDRLKAPGACKCCAPSTARTRTRTTSGHILEHLLLPLQDGATKLPVLHLERKAVVLSVPTTRRFHYDSSLEELFRAQALATI